MAENLKIKASVRLGIMMNVVFVPYVFFPHSRHRRCCCPARHSASIWVKERDDRIFTLKTGPYTAYAYVVPSSLDAIKVNDFVGSAVKGPLGSFVAVELAIIPEDMQAGRISLYDWDPLPDPTARHTSDRTATSMTNGLVSKISPAPRK